MHTFIENYLHFMKNCIRPHYEKLNPLKSGFIENSNFENNRDPCHLDQWCGKEGMRMGVAAAAADGIPINNSIRLR